MTRRARRLYPERCRVLLREAVGIIGNSRSIEDVGGVKLPQLFPSLGSPPVSVSGPIQLSGLVYSAARMSDGVKAAMA